VSLRSVAATASKDCAAREFGGAAAHAVGVAFGRQVELGIERIEVFKAAPAVTRAHDLDRSEDALQLPPLRALMGVRLTGRVADCARRALMAANRSFLHIQIL